MQTDQIIIYQTADGQTAIDVKLENETIWLSLNQISTLFSRDKSVISRHLSNIFKEEELEQNSVVAKNATTGSDGKTYQVDYFNLDVIISVGYRVNSKRGTQFRIWANKVVSHQRLLHQRKTFKRPGRAISAYTQCRTVKHRVGKFNL